MEFKDKLKALRKEKGISQQALADAIFVSRSAVAKWENGLGLPSEESYEALAAYFGIPRDDFITAEPETVIVEKNRDIRSLSMTLTTVVGLVIAAVIVAVLLKGGGYFNIIDRVTSPNGQVVTTVYSGTPGGFYLDDGFTLSDTGAFAGRTIYPGARYQGVYWSANCQFQLVCLYAEGKQFYALIDYRHNISCNLISYLNRAMYGMEAFENTYRDENGHRKMELRFLYWDTYESKMYFSYDFIDTDGEFCSGYFWYDAESSTILAVDP